MNHPSISSTFLDLLFVFAAFLAATTQHSSYIALSLIDPDDTLPSDCSTPVVSATTGFSTPQPAFQLACHSITAAAVAALAYTSNRTSTDIALLQTTWPPVLPPPVPAESTPASRNSSLFSLVRLAPPVSSLDQLLIDDYRRVRCRKGNWPPSFST